MASPNTKRNPDKMIDKNELYSTPDIALEEFYKQHSHVLDQYDVYLDPCDGMSQISNFLERLGKKVYRYDIVDYQGKLNGVEDFLNILVIPSDVQCIIFNPPFTMTEQFVDKALSLCPKLIMFNRLTTIESLGRANKFASKEWPLKSMFQFGFRVSCPKGVNFEPTANSVAYAWFELDKEYLGDGKLKWIV